MVAHESGGYAAHPETDDARVIREKYNADAPTRKVAKESGSDGESKAAGSGSAEHPEEPNIVEFPTSGAPHAHMNAVNDRLPTVQCVYVCRSWLMLY